MSEPFDVFDQIDKISVSEGGGGGIIALTTVACGYKVYPTGVPQVETFFPFVPGDDEARVTAKASAEALATLHGVKVPSFGVQIVAHRSGALTQGVSATWKDNRYFNVNAWPRRLKPGSTDEYLPNAYHDIVAPSLKACGITTFPWTGWARIGFKQDTYKVSLGEAGMTDKNQDGSPRFPLVAYIVEAFPDEATAKAQAVANPEGAVAPAATAWKPESEGWDAASLKEIGVTLQGELTVGKSLTQVATEYGMSVADALVALGIHRTKLPPVAEANRLKVDVAEVSKMRGLAESIPF
jgi:hypothetical protein